MQNDYNELFNVVFNVLFKENARSVLEVSGFGAELGQLISLNLKSKPDRIDISDNFLLSGGVDSGIYNNVYGSELFQSLSELDTYDVIVIFHLFENIHPEGAKPILKSLLEKTKKQVLLITPEYPYDLNHENKLSDVREYNPIFFLGFDFGYKMIRSASGDMQMYCFFPQPEYALLPCDEALLASDDGCDGASMPDKKLKLCFIAFGHNLTGGAKAFFEMMNILSKRGHHVTALLQSDTGSSAIPPWSKASDNHAIIQKVIPKKNNIIDHIDDCDVVFLCWAPQIPNFEHCKVPVVLWEQGSSAIFGDHEEMFFSDSFTRKQMRDLYRSQVYILSVSEAISAILSGKYNRESLSLPPPVDTDWFHPPTYKNNTVPIVLLVGNPMQSFKGFRHMLKALEIVHRLGHKFKVHWASQYDFSLSSISFDLELFIDRPQDEVAELYRNADILLSASLYESFCLPPLEAAASGTAVIAFDNGGIMTYAEPEENLLLCEQGDVQSMVEALVFLLNNSEAREKLAARGRETAERFSHESTAKQAESCLYRIVNAHM
ncbi:MAG: glycosyltransferase family 4 protein [Oscillospiraceae bacterium]|nr:glycosyltransferase family 4 protein [Oscillospiraceae bacterium]